MLDLDAIKKRLAALSAEGAYPLPWQELGESGEFWIEAANGMAVLDSTNIYEPLTSFLENAPADLAALVAEVEAERERADLNFRAGVGYREVAERAEAENTRLRAVAAALVAALTPVTRDFLVASEREALARLEEAVRDD